MDCRSVEEAILDCLENAGTASVQREIDVHLAGCPACTAFAARQQSVDAQLSRMMVSPELSPGFRKALRNRIRREAMQLWADSLPDKVHFLSCGFATVMSAILMPFHPAAVLSAGAAATVVTYLLMTAVRTFFDSAEESGQ
jgi:predicted anti-sigma-YlaC factor YlaD